jgi:hypothetical protein
MAAGEECPNLCSSLWATDSFLLSIHNPNSLSLFLDKKSRPLDTVIAGGAMISRDLFVVFSTMKLTSKCLKSHRKETEISDFA